MRLGPNLRKVDPVSKGDKRRHTPSAPFGTIPFATVPEV